MIQARIRYTGDTALWLSFHRYNLDFQEVVAHSAIQHGLRCVFTLFVFDLCTIFCQYLWNAHFVLPLRYSLSFIYPSRALSSLLFLMEAVFRIISCIWLFVLTVLLICFSLLYSFCPATLLSFCSILWLVYSHICIYCLQGNAMFVTVW